MAARKEKIGIGMQIRPEIDPKAVAEVIRDAQALQKRLSSMKMDWKSLSKQARANISEIQNMSSAAEQFAKKLGKGAQESFKKLKTLGDQLEEATDKAAAVKQAYGDQKDPKVKEALGEELGSLSKTISGLNKQITDQQKTSKKYGSELKNVLGSQIKFRQSLESAASYTGKNFSKDITASLSNLGKGPGGIRAFLGDVAGATGKAAGGGVARGAIAEQDAGTGEAMQSIAKAVPALTAAVAVLAAFWEILKKASQHMTKLNKELLDGGGFARELTVKTVDYRKSVDDLRDASIAAADDLLAIGGTSSTASKAIGAFSKETTGSLQRTEETLKRLGGGDLKQGVAEFAKVSFVYGKALGMEADEVGTMMGKFVSEAGYGADQVQDLMGNVVKAAATANMPLTKFMDIFKSVIPDVELYKNRLEELTGVIKVLSKTMSAKDVKDFTEAFAKGFGGTDFKQRLKTVLISGTEFVSKVLDKDFTSKARAIAEQFKEYGGNEDEVIQAMRGGEKTMAALMAKYQGVASQQGKELNATAVGDAMKLAGYEGARQKGGALNMATAMSGAGMGATYRILKQQSQAFTQGFDGLSEHVIKQTGITEQQYQAMRSFSQSMEVYQAQIQKFGKTQSKSLNDSLKKVLARRGETNLMKATEEDIIDAAADSNKFDKQDLSQQKDIKQVTVDMYNVTTSLDEKIDNVIGYLLEKVYEVLDKYILTTLNDLYDYLSMGKSGNTLGMTQKRVDKSLLTQDDTKEMSDDAKKRLNDVHDQIAKTAADGTQGVDWIGKMKDSFSVDDLRGISGSYGEYAKSQALKQGKSEDEAEKIAQTVSAQMSSGVMDNDVNKALWALKDTPGDWKDAFTVLNSMVGKEKLRIEKQKQGRRGGTETVADKLAREDAEKKKKESDDRVDLSGEIEKLTDVQSDAAAAAGANQPVRMGTTTVEHVRPGAGPAGTPGATDPVTAASADQQQATKESGEDITQSVATTTDAIGDLHDKINKGIPLDKTYTNNVLKNVIKEATLASFRKALLEFSVIEAKIKSQDEFAKALAASGGDVIEAGVNMQGLYGATDQDSLNKIVEAAKGSKLSGGPIPDTGMYKLHRGEYVVPALPASTARGGGGGTNITHININGTSLTQQQLQSAVVQAMDQVARRS